MKTMKNVIKKTLQKITKVINHKLTKILPKKMLKLSNLRNKYPTKSPQNYGTTKRTRSPSEKEYRFAFVGFTGDFWHKTKNLMKNKLKLKQCLDIIPKDFCLYIDLTT